MTPWESEGRKKLKNVLLINGDGQVQDKVRDILSEQDDYNLIVADTAKDAFVILDSREVNFVLFDVDVALDEGVNKLLEMKEKYPDIPIVATTPIKHGRPEDAIAPEYNPNSGR